MLDIKNIYKETKYIDDLFQKQYDMKDPKIIKKYKLELLVEFGELANETRCFKFWSNRQTGIKEKVLEEYIDCLFMILYFCNINDISLDEEFEESKNKNEIDTFFLLYEYGNSLIKRYKKETIKKLLVEILHLSELLGFTLEDLENETIRKSKVIQERLTGNY